MRAFVIGAVALACLAEPAMADPNTLTAAEQAAGWKLLFDGKSMDAWRGYQKPASDWKVVEETLARRPR